MLRVHRAVRSDALADGLADLLAASPPPDPLQAEVVAVPTRGIERWLSQHLGAVLGAGPGRRDGICANVVFPFPASLVSDATSAVTGIDPGDDPWLPERAVWPLLEVVDGHLHEPWLAQLAGHLGRPGGAQPDEARAHRRFATVRRLADLFDRYGVHRPAMVQAWAGGDDTDDAGQALADGWSWQPQLWRLLRRRLGVASPAERLPDACARLVEDPAAAPLPPRVSLFGLTRLPASYVEILRALGTARDVHLWLLHPSPALWQEVERLQLPATAGPPRRHEDTTVDRALHPLLRSWGRDAREMQLVVTGAVTAPAPPAGGEGPPTGSLLHRIQADITANRTPAGSGTLAPDDRSVQVHSCHGRSRQVEVLRDTLLHLFDADPTLEPRDVVVLCPDIEEFAPHVQAVFASPVASVGGQLRVRLADRSLRQTNPVLAATSRLLDLVGSRAGAPELVDLLASPPVRRRFAFDDDDLDRIASWVTTSGIRWGFDADSRTPYLGSPLEEGTWRAGLDRILLGVVLSEEDLPLVGGVLPLDDVASTDVELAGRMAEAVDRVQEMASRFARPATTAEWSERLEWAAETLFSVGDADAWQLAQLHGIVDAVVTESDHSEVPLGPGELRALLADRLRGRPTRANFRTGALTICTLVPMRSVPHRVVCLLGLDDDAFPRRAPADGDDLTLEQPRVGDRDGRGEDRQLLLDALMAAREHLVVVFSGRDERTNRPRPPCVPIGELLDVIDQTVSGADGEAASEGVVWSHPLQTFDPRNFRVDGESPGPWGPWGFDRSALAGAVALGAGAVPAATASALPAPEPSQPLELEALVRAISDPLLAYVRVGLGIRPFTRGDDLTDRLPMTLDALEEWSIGDRVLDQLLTGVPADRIVEAERVRGELPPGELGRARLEVVMGRASQLASAAGGRRRQGASTDVVVEVGGRRLVGTVPAAGATLVVVTYSRIKAKQQLTAWVRLLALAAQQPDRGWTARLIGRRGAGPWAVEEIALAPPAGTPDERRERARVLLGDLIALHDKVTTRQVPLSADAAMEWAAARRAHRDPARKAGAAWDQDYGVAQIYGEKIPFSAVLAERPDGDEPPSTTQEETLVGRLSIWLCDALLEGRTNR